MNQIGFVKIHRKLLNWEWYSNLPARVLLIHLLLIVNYEDKKWQGKVIKRGSCITSVSKLSVETRLTIKQVRIALDNLERTNEITRYTTANYTEISLNNFDKYQDVTNQRAKQGQTKGQTKDKQKGKQKGKAENSTNPSISAKNSGYNLDKGKLNGKQDDAKRANQTATTKEYNNTNVLLSKEEKKERKGSPASAASEGGDGGSPEFVKGSGIYGGFDF